MQPKEMKGIGIKEVEGQKFKEELSWFILEEQKRSDELRDLLKQLDAGLISGKGLRSKLSLFSRSSRRRAQILNHLVGMAVKLTRQEGKEVNHPGVFNRPMARREISR